MAIEIKPSHEGRLHKNLGVAEDKAIPEAKLEAAKNSDSPAVRKQATFAENAKHWHHGGQKKDGHHRNSGHPGAHRIGKK